MTPLKTLTRMSTIINHLLSQPKVFGRPYLLWRLPLLVSGGNRRLMISCRATRCNGFAKKTEGPESPPAISAFPFRTKSVPSRCQTESLPCAKSCDDRMAMISYLSQSCNEFSSNHPEEETKKTGCASTPAVSASCALWSEQQFRISQRI